MPRWRDSGWTPSSVEDAELVAQADDGPPPDLLSEVEGRQAAQRRYKTRTDIRAVPRAYETLAPGSVPTHLLRPSLEAIERMSYQGLTIRQIAGRIGITSDELKNYATNYLDVELALTGGRARAADELSAEAMLAALGGDNKMLVTLLERKHGFTPPAPPSAPPVQVNIGGPAVGFARADELARRQIEIIEALAIEGPAEES